MGLLNNAKKQAKQLFCLLFWLCCIVHIDSTQNDLFQMQNELVENRFGIDQVFSRL